MREQEINKIKGLNEKVALSDYLLEGETKSSELLTDLEYQKIGTLHNIMLLESKLIKLEISPERTDRIKNSVFIILVYVIAKSKSILKIIFF